MSAGVNAIRFALLRTILAESFTLLTIRSESRLASLRILIESSRAAAATNAALSGFDGRVPRWMFTLL